MWTQIFNASFITIVVSLLTVLAVLYAYFLKWVEKKAKWRGPEERPSIAGGSGLLEGSGWYDHPNNPLITTNTPKPAALVGDPCVLDPSQTASLNLPDDQKWQMFVNSLFGIYRYSSPDGVKWTCRQRVVWNAMRAWCIQYNKLFYLFFDDNLPWLFPSTGIGMVISSDLVHWSSKSRVLSPSLDWEGSFLSNPCIIRRRDEKLEKDEFWMYYSANQVFLKDMGFSEPMYIGVAKSSNISGPYHKNQKPILGPIEEDGSPYRNRGAGAIKVYESEGLTGTRNSHPYFGFNNGIFENSEGQSSSAIILMRSKDGLKWEEYSKTPLIAPTGRNCNEETKWKCAHVYQMDMKRVVEGKAEKIYMWYNARDGWRVGAESIGLSILENAGDLWKEEEEEKK